MDGEVPVLPQRDLTWYIAGFINQMVIFLSKRNPNTPFVCLKPQLVAEILRCDIEAVINESAMSLSGHRISRSREVRMHSQDPGH
jgi:hypothetical protein